MATLQDEMQRFLTARFGEDVRDAFVSCIRKIHAENMAFADEANNITQQVETTLNNANIAISQKVDGAYVENGYLFLTANGEPVAGPIGPFAGSGGGGGSGGGDSGNNAALTVTNSSGWLTKTIALGNSCPISITWYSLEDELPTGNGIMKIVVNGITRATVDIPQGNVTHDLKEYVSTGANNVRVTISDIYGNSRTINFNVDVKDISLSSDFDPATPYTGFITFPYTPVGNVSKVMHFVVDGTELDTFTTTSSGRRLEFDIPPQSHGSHTIEVWFECEINSSIVESNKLFFSFMSIEAGNTTPIISSDFNRTEAEQFESLAIRYRVYDPVSATAPVRLLVNGLEVSAQTVDRTQQTWTYRVDSVGSLSLAIESGMAKKEWNLTVSESGMHIGAEQNNLDLFLSSYGRSNNEANPGTWVSGGISATFNGFNFASDGWQHDADDISVLRVAGDARVSIPLQVFASDARTMGKTIEVEFATRDVMDYDAVIMSCFSGGRGFRITPQLAELRSEQRNIFTQFKENEHCRISFVIERRNQNRLIYCYINGIMSGVVQYPDDDDFAQFNPVGISVGSNDAVIDLYSIRVYSNSLNRHQILGNWIADTQVIEQMLERYQRNNVFDDYDQIVISQLPNDLPYLILDGSELPQSKGDKKTISGSYTDPLNASKSFTFDGAEIDVQGTSSATYARKNYKIKFKRGFVVNGQQSDKYAMRSDSVPTSTFTFKADVASSEGANNVELVRLYESANPYKTKAQKANSKVRQGIDGFPIVIFWHNGNDTTFLGKYNFNNDKGTPEVFGFSGSDESWEILNNTSNRALFKSADFTTKIDGEFAWLKDFEGRYPDKNENGRNLQALLEWVSSTDTDAATGSSLSSSVTLGGVTYTRDTADYRLAKFKSGFSEHFEKDAILFYYLFTELFLMIDSRAKNAFPTFIQGSPWFMLPYDFDTAIGINNEGTLAFSYNLEDIDQTETGEDVFNGQQSVLWKNLRACYFDDIKAMYQNLRASGALSYDKIEKQFEEHQAKWPEAIFNEDSWFKYLAPLVETNTAAYLAMLQGSKAEQRKWWLYNRFRYIDSKYNAGDALSDVITLRGYAKSDITVTPYADIYATVKYGSYLVQQRANRNQSYTLACPLDNVNDTEIYVYSSSQVKDIGDISGLKVGYADFSNAVRLQNLKIGDASSSYTNYNLSELYLGNNTLLRTIDVRNCRNLAMAVDLSGCSNIEHIYFDGTAITGLKLPNGGIIKTLHLPSSLTNLTIQNQTAITDFRLPSYSNISTLRLENVSSAVDMRGILNSIPANSRVRLVGFRWEIPTVSGIFALYDMLDTMRGLDENGNNTDKAQLIGTISTGSLTGAEMAQMLERYPYINIEYTSITSYLRFYDDTGENLLQTVSISNGGDGSYSGSTPSKADYDQYSYTFAGWSKFPGGDPDPMALKNVTADRNVYAAYTKTARTYTVRFYNGTTLLQTVSGISYGGSASYTGSTPVHTTDPDNNEFTGWSPSPVNIKADTSCYAQYRFTGETLGDMSWADIKALTEDGSFLDRLEVGDKKNINLTYQSGTVKSVVFEIVMKATTATSSRKLIFLAKDSVASSVFDADGKLNYEQADGSSSTLKTYVEGAMLDLFPNEVRSVTDEITIPTFAIMNDLTKTKRALGMEYWIKTGTYGSPANVHGGYVTSTGNLYRVDSETDAKKAKYVVPIVLF